MECFRSDTQSMADDRDIARFSNDDKSERDEEVEHFLSGTQSTTDDKSVGRFSN